MPLEVITNTGVTPVIADKAGHEIAPGDYLVADTDDKVTAAQIAAGNIGVCDRPDDMAGISDAAAAAFTQLAKTPDKTPDAAPGTTEPEKVPAGSGAADEGAAGAQVGDEGVAAQSAPTESAAPSHHRGGRKPTTTEGAK